MKFTPLQVREIVGISQETLRHWRKVIPELKGRNGYSPCFTAGDVLALKVINEIVDTLQVRVQALAPLATNLFNICRGIHWPRLENQCLVIRFPETLIETCRRDNICSDEKTSAMVVVPLNQHISAIRDRLTGAENQPQCDLPFPPMAMQKQSTRH